MKKPLIATALLSPLFLAATHISAVAATDTIPFSGTVDPVCTILVDSPGTIAPNTDHTALSSQEAGGSPGVATIQTSNANFSVSTTAPTVFTSAPTGGDTDVTFATFYSASGATTLDNIAGSSASVLDQGTTTLSVDLTATKASGTFPDGNYAADVVVTCE